MDLSAQRLKHSGADGDGGGGGEDRLSDLPDDVLIDILVLVDDAAEAARTSVLARRWRRLWALLPELSFNFIGHHRIDAALAAHQVPDLSLLFVLTEDPYPEFVSEWLPAAARSLSGHIDLEVFRPDTEPVAEERGDIDLPCFEKATSITLKLGFLGLALPSSGVFARLRGLQLVDVRLHGQSGLGELLSSQRCPSLKSVIVCQARGLDSFNIHSESLLNIELSNLHCLQQLTVIAPVLEILRVKNCFTNPLDPDLSVANISAPQLKLPGWTIFRIYKFEKSKKLRAVKDFLLQNTKKKEKKILWRTKCPCATEITLKI
jgi:hypothetical protein